MTIDKGEGGLAEFKNLCQFHPYLLSYSQLHRPLNQKRHLIEKFIENLLNF